MKSHTLPNQIGNEPNLNGPAGRILLGRRRRVWTTRRERTSRLASPPPERRHTRRPPRPALDGRRTHQEKPRVQRKMAQKIERMSSSFRSWVWCLHEGRSTAPPGPGVTAVTSPHHPGDRTPIDFDGAGRGAWSPFGVAKICILWGKTIEKDPRPMPVEYAGGIK